jgi:acyl-CoA thioesterase FadM
MAERDDESNRASCSIVPCHSTPGLAFAGGCLGPGYAGGPGEWRSWVPLTWLTVTEVIVVAKDPLQGESAAATAGIADTFTQRFQVRFDECAPDGTARASAILRYVVETAFGHSAAAGYPLSWYFSHGLFWLVRRLRLRLDEPIAYGAVLDVTTCVTGVRRFWARRENLVRDPTGRPVGMAAMDWIFSDEVGRPNRIPHAMERAFPVSPAQTPPDRMDIGDPPGHLTPSLCVVPAHETDPRGHANNAAYLDLFEDALQGLGLDPQKRAVVYELEYLKSVVAGDTLKRFVWEMPSGAAMIAHVDDGTAVVRARRHSAVIPGLA